MKFWLVSDIDVAAASFLAKFHVIIEWVDEAEQGRAKPPAQTSTLTTLRCRTQRLQRPQTNLQPIEDPLASREAAVGVPEATRVSYKEGSGNVLETGVFKT